MAKTNDTAALQHYITIHGPIQAVRVSSAQARGAAKQYPYWGAVRYEIRLRQRDGVPVAVAQERASSDRRSRRLAEQDASDIADREGRIEIDTIGEIRATEILTPAEIARYGQQASATGVGLL